MQSPISGSFGGLPPHNQPFRGWQLLGETLVTATSLLLSPTAEVTAVWCGLELQLGFSCSLFFSFPTLLPSLRFVLHWRLLHGCGGSLCISPGAGAVDNFVIMGGAGGARKDGISLPTCP